MTELIDIPSGVQRKLSPDAIIYKDDCMYCFDTADNNDLGLDICLHCYYSFSRGTLNHTKEHYDKKGHSVYLNVVKKLKPNDQNKRNQDGERQQKMAKLEVKDLSEEEIYDIANRVYDVLMDRYYNLEEITADFSSLIQEILRSTSSQRKDEISAWEQEILPCEHSVDLQQILSKGTYQLDQCADCSLKENLWICLHCGSIGCGREQFGSSLKGNSHALKHYESINHPVAIKLGSLSSEENSCDAYCYKCNDEVKVPGLADKLANFGIDLKSTVKTEKSLVELNLDQNLNWDFKLDGANGEKLQTIFGPGFTGFQNLGNSCYLNSVIQALFSLDNYQEYFSNQKFPDVENPSKDILSQLIKIYDGLLSGRYSKPNTLKGDDYQLGIKPSTFKTLIGENHEEFKTQRQQDAYEFLLYVLENIDKSLGLKLNSDFNFLMGNTVMCSKCQKGTLKYELIDNISVLIEEEIIGTDPETGKKIYKEVNLIDSIKRYCSPESIEGYQCDKCNLKDSIAIRSTGFKSFPKTLIVNVKRIKLQNWTPVKIDVPIEIPSTISKSVLEELRTPEDNFEAGTLEIKTETEGSTQEVFEPNSEALSTLESMGFPEVRCLKALYNTGNNNAEDAMNWLFAHMDDIDIDEPFTYGATSGESNEPCDEKIENLANMGFSKKLSKKALILSNNDINAAVEWLFTNPGDDGELKDVIPKVDVAKERSELSQSLMQIPSAGDYHVKAVVCHKGTTPHTGHYVVFIKKIINGTSQWVLYNDEKVVICDDNSLEDIKNNGYIYFFEKSEG